MGYKQYALSRRLQGSANANISGHPIADAHPGNVDAIVFPGQDYNNARVYDFEDVQSWENNKRKIIFP